MRRLSGADPSCWQQLFRTTVPGESRTRTVTRKSGCPAARARQCQHAGAAPGPGQPRDRDSDVQAATGRHRCRRTVTAESGSLKPGREPIRARTEKLSLIRPSLKKMFKVTVALAAIQRFGHAGRAGCTTVLVCRACRDSDAPSRLTDKLIVFLGRSPGPGVTARRCPSEMPGDVTAAALHGSIRLGSGLAGTREPEPPGPPAPRRVRVR